MLNGGIRLDIGEEDREEQSICHGWDEGVRRKKGRKYIGSEDSDYLGLFDPRLFRLT